MTSEALPLLYDYGYNANQRLLAIHGVHAREQDALFLRSLGFAPDNFVRLADHQR